MRLKIALILLLVFAAFPAHAFDLESRVEEFRLSNGMKWLLVRRTQAPVFSGIVMIRVGGADEVEGKTGVAHVFEHMAFKGSYRLGTKDFQKEKPLLDKIEKLGDELTQETKKDKPDAAKVKELSAEIAKLEKEADAYRSKNEIWEVLSRNGAEDLNAYTSKDVTAYHASLPVNRMKLWARITAEMIFNPSYREFYTERSVIAEERRASVENDPDGVMGEKLLESSYDGGPYHWSTIGFEKDILGLTIADARAFHDKYYVPSNMVGVLVGDFSVAMAKSIIKSEFGKYPAALAPEAPKASGRELGDVVKTIGYDAEPSIAIAYHKPTLPNPAEYSFDVIEALLCGGRSSRLEKKLVYEKRIVRDIYCTVGHPGSRLPNLFLLWIETLNGHTPGEVLREVDVEIARLSREPVGDEELTRVRKNVKSSLIFALEKNMTLAEQLAEFQTIFGDWRLLAHYPEKIDEIGAKDVMEMAKKYLNNSNRVVIKRVRSKK